MTNSAPSTAFRATAGSARSPSTSSYWPCAGRFSRSPVEKLSAILTDSPRRSSSSTICEPMKPASPVTTYRATRSSLLGPARFRQARHDSQCIFVIKLLQHGVGQIHAVELPERVIVPVVVEVLVLRLEYAPVVRVLLGLERVLAEENPVLVLDEEIMRRARLAPEGGENCADLAGDV